MKTISTLNRPLLRGHKSPGCGVVVRLIGVDVDDDGRITRTYLTRLSNGHWRTYADRVRGTVSLPLNDNFKNKDD